MKKEYAAMPDYENNSCDSAKASDNFDNNGTDRSEAPRGFTTA